MTDLILQGNTQALTMSSREIAQVVESRHDNVKRTMETLFGKGLIAFTQTEEKTAGRPGTVYRVCKRDSYVVVAQLSPEFTARLVDRWQELEAQHAVTNEDSLLKHITPVAKVIIEDLNGTIEHLQSETKRLNTVCNDLAANLKDGLTPVEFCRMLNGVHLNRVQPDLVQRKRLLKTDHGYRVPAAYRGDLFVERRHFNTEGRLCEKVILTRKGAKWLYAEYEKGHLTMRKDWDGSYSHLVFENGEAA